MNPKSLEYICTTCAKIFGAEFPEAQRIEYMYSRCDACENKRSVCRVSDFEFPNHKVIKG